MATKTQFQNAATGADVYVPKYFGVTLLSALKEFNTDRTDIDKHEWRLQDLLDDMRFIPKSELQGRVVRTYLDFMDAVDDSVMFIAFCMKNQPFMYRACKWIENDAVTGVPGFKVMALADPAHLEREMAHFKDKLFNGALLARSLFTDDGRAALAEEADGDDTFLSGAAPTNAEFYDWVEDGFFDLHHLPLNLYPRSDTLDREIMDKLKSGPYATKLMIKIRDGLLQEQFPGLSLDGDISADAQLADIRQHMAQHAATFTPSETAHVIRFGHAAQTPSGSGTLTRCTLVYSAPRGPAR